MDENVIVKRNLRLLDYLTKYSTFNYQSIHIDYGTFGIPKKKEVEEKQDPLDKYPFSAGYDCLTFEYESSWPTISITTVKEFCEKYTIRYQEKVEEHKSYKHKDEIYFISVLDNYEEIYGKILEEYSNKEKRFLEIVENHDILIKKLQKCIADIKEKLKVTIIHDLHDWGEFRGNISQWMKVSCNGIEWNYYNDEDINDEFSGYISFFDLQYENITESQRLALIYFLRQYITTELSKYSDEITAEWKNQNIMYKIENCIIDFRISNKEEGSEYINIALSPKKVSLRKWE